MANFVRKTEHSREELFYFFDKGKLGNFYCKKESPGQGIPIGLVISEVGVIFLTTDLHDDEHAEVERFLTSIVSDRTQYERNRAKAFFYLRHPDAVFVCKESQSLVEEYEYDPDNRLSVEQTFDKLQKITV